MMSPIQAKILAAYETLAEDYNRLIDHKPHNAYYDRPNTLGLLPPLNGKAVLDAACGPGKYAEIMLEQGAIVTGFDISPSMVRLAQARNRNKGKFFVQDISQPFAQLHDESFDVVLCALALQYVEDWTATMKEFCRVLKPKGCLVLSIEHPFFEHLFFESKEYFATKAVKCIWKGFGTPVEVNSFRRPLGACIAPITENGFFIDKILEPKPIAEFELADPRHFKELNEFPAFLCIRAVKR